MGRTGITVAIMVGLIILQFVLVHLQLKSIRATMNELSEYGKVISGAHKTIMGRGSIVAMAVKKDMSNAQKSSWVQVLSADSKTLVKLKERHWNKSEWSTSIRILPKKEKKNSKRLHWKMH